MSLFKKRKGKVGVTTSLRTYLPLATLNVINFCFTNKLIISITYFRTSKLFTQPEYIHLQMKPHSAVRGKNLIQFTEVLRRSGLLGRGTSVFPI